MIGIGGTGLSAIARVLLERGYTISGSDRVESRFTHDLSSAGATIYIGHCSENVRGANLVIRSSAILDDNPEVAYAYKEGIPVLKRFDFLGSMMVGKFGIAVAGTHGKTTTASMLAWLLTSLGMEPSFIVGGVLANFGVNARAGKGSSFVIEADEYDRMFLGLKPTIEIVTNVEYDHPDCYPTPLSFQAAFEEFVNLLPETGSLVIGIEDPGAVTLFKQIKEKIKNIHKYGLSQSTVDDKYTMDSYTENYSIIERGGSTFQASILGERVEATLNLPGKHNIRNALAALTVIKLMGLDLKSAACAITQFKGICRRFELRGEACGIKIIDDYAHHPTEIQATLSAARSMYPGSRIWAVWQPHTYSRTKTLFNDYIHSFESADEVLVTEIYPSREPKQDFSSREVVNAMDHPSAQYSGTLKNTWEILNSNLENGDVVLVLSAGDADEVSNEVFIHLKEKENG